MSWLTDRGYWPAAMTGGSAGPTGTQQTISSYFQYDNPVGNMNAPGSAVQPAGQAWYAANNAWGKPPAGTQLMKYYAADFPNYTTIEWQGAGSGTNVLGYPEIAIGNISGGVSFPPNGNTGSAVPSWYGAKLSSLSRFVISWDITINSFSGNNWDILFEGYPGGTTTGGGGNETGLVIRDPGWWGETRYEYTSPGGVPVYIIPNGWAKGSLTVIPVSAFKSPTTPLLSGEIDLWPIFSYAASRGWMSMSSPVNGWEFGCEYTQGSGSVTFNGLSLAVS